MAEDMSKIVPDFILGDSLAKAITEGTTQSGESKYYTVEQKPGRTLVYGMNSASYVKDTIELTDSGKKQNVEVWNVEEIDKYKKDAKKWNRLFYVTIIPIVLIFVALVILLEVKL